MYIQKLTAAGLALASIASCTKHPIIFPISVSQQKCKLYKNPLYLTRHL